MFPLGRAVRPVRSGIFELDPRAGELRKFGVKPKLQDKPLVLLGMLLGTPGEVVTRGDLKERLWPADTFVDFDHSLSIAVHKLRLTPGDNNATFEWLQLAYLDRSGRLLNLPIDPGFDVLRTDHRLTDPMQRINPFRVDAAAKS